MRRILVQPSDDREPRAEQRRDHALPDRAGHGDGPHRQQLLDMELQADAEHQQDDADLGELFGDRGIGCEPGVYGPRSVPASR